MAVQVLEPMDSSRLTTAPGLTSLQGLRKACDFDVKRTDATIMLNNSMAEWVARKSPMYAGGDLAKIAGSQRRLSFQKPRATKILGRKQNEDGFVMNLEEAFLAHSAAFDLDGDGSICVEELILILERCGLFDEFFTPTKIKNYFTTWAEGCNQQQRSSAPLTDGAIGFEEFQDVLRWGADIKGVEFAACAQKVVRLSRKLCDKSSSVQKRLEVVFDAFCKKLPNRMSAFEFGGLCQKVGIFQEDRFTMGDVYSLFYQISGVVHGEGVDFSGFIDILPQVGHRLGIELEEIQEIFAKAVELLDTDEETIIRVKMRLKHSAGVVGGSDWRHFFHACDPDASGYIDWDEFLAMCREKLHLNDRNNHLRILFDKLDVDGAGELNLDTLIRFIEA